MKYLIVQPYDRVTARPTGEQCPILFPANEHVSHKDVAAVHRASARAVVAAAFCDISFYPDRVDVVAYGSSESLRHERPSRTEDAGIIAAMVDRFVAATSVPPQ